MEVDAEALSRRKAHYIFVKVLEISIFDCTIIQHDTPKFKIGYF